MLGSANSANISTDFENGWLDIGFFPSTVTGEVHTLGNDATIVTDIFANSTVGPATYVGLPVVGFAVRRSEQRHHHQRHAGYVRQQLRPEGHALDRCIRAFGRRPPLIPDVGSTVVTQLSSI